MATVGPVVAVVALLLPTTVGASGPAQGIGFGRGGSTSGTGVLGYCSHGLAGARTGWFCESATAKTRSGYARGWTQMVLNLSVPISGFHYFHLNGAFNLSTGFARASGNCSGGGSGYSDVYLFWHIWVFDNTLGTYVSQSNSGYLWQSGTLICPTTGGGSLASPAMRTAFSTANYTSTGATGYTFSSTHSYEFTLFLGCTAEASFSAPAPGPSSSEVGAFCNFPTGAPSNTFTISKLSIV